ncbi:hypothetical protein [Kitasatospora sp. NPDC050463]|uniref:hypothetical protein n=1 Tax=Kitasatospora sp. NPDC050463 TaxID=3155786 RepID=UPI0033F586DE
MPHTAPGVPVVLWPAVGYLALYLLLALAAARELRARAGPAGVLRQWTVALWTMPGFFLATVLSPLRDGTAARFLSATAAGAAGNAALLTLTAHAAGLG